MGRPKKQKSPAEVTLSAVNSLDESDISQQDDAFVRRNVDETPTKAERISLKLKDDGTVDWDSHRGDTRERIVKAFSNDPETLRMIGLSSPLLPAGQGVTDENARAALRLLATANGMLIPVVTKMFFKMKIEPKVATQAFQFTDSQLDEMSPRAARIANKYSSAAMLKYQDEIALLGMFGLYLSEQVKTAIEMQVTLNMQRAANPPTIQMPPEGVNGTAKETETTQ